MYRLLLTCLLLVAAAPGQRPMARIVLKDGTTMTGAVLRQSDDVLVLRIGNRPRIVQVDDIDDLEVVTTDTPPPGANPADRTNQRETERRLATAPGAQEPEPEGYLEAVGNAAITQIRDLNKAAMQWLQRHLWVVPRSTSTRISLGLGIWLVLGFIVHVSSIFNGVQHTSVMRAQLMSLVLVTIAVLQTLVPLQGLQVLALVGVDLVLWLLVTQLLYQAGLARGLLMLLTTVVLVLLAVVCLMLANYLVEVVQAQPF